MKERYTYKAFGIVIESEFEIPELIKIATKADIKIRLGKTPEKLEEITKRGVKYQATKNKFLLEVDNIARYYVENGISITVELYKKTADKEVRLFLLGSALGALFIQRGLLPIHGSAVMFGNTACIFSGVSGVGKSSLAASFVKNGYPFLSDDISVIDNDLKIHPAFPRMKIWDDVINNLQIKKAGLSEIRPEIKKYDVNFSDSFCENPMQVNKVFIINSKNTDGFEYEELKGLAKFNALKANTYRYRFVGGLEKQQYHFKILNKLLSAVDVYKISRPQSPILLDQLADYILKTFNLDE